MGYKIRISETCIKQIKDTLDYIDNELQDFNASNRLKIKIKKCFNRIKFFPRLYPQIFSNDKLKRNYRKVVIEKYIILYTIIEEDQIIFISDFYYMRRNYSNY